MPPPLALVSRARKLLRDRRSRAVLPVLAGTAAWWAARDSFTARRSVVAAAAVAGAAGWATVAHEVGDRDRRRLRREMDATTHELRRLHRDLVAVSDRHERLDAQLRDTHRFLGVRSTQVLSQSQDLARIYAELAHQTPLPPLLGFSIAPDTALLLVQLVRERRPKTLVELGSGSSSVLFAAAFESFAIEGRIISLDHEDRFLDQTRRHLAAADLEHRVELVHAPLRDQVRGEESFRWYDLDALEGPDEIDFLFIDGPPGNTATHARYPALRFLAPALSDRPIVVLDDARRTDESETVARWQLELPDLTFEHFPMMTGCAVGYACGHRPAGLPPAQR